MSQNAVFFLLFNPAMAQFHARYYLSALYGKKRTGPRKEATKQLPPTA